MFWKRKKPTGPRSEPRDHHYAFAHVVLRDVCASDPLQLFAIVASPEQERFIAWLWELTEKRVGKPIAELDPKTLAVTTCRIGEHPAIIVRMPAPEAVAEAHLVGLLLTSVPESASEAPASVAFRYFTLEHGVNMDGSARTVLCEWADGVHRNFGEGPEATESAFIEALAGKL
ncbi:hypothetical protein DZC73_28485 [Albitalea terrae]|uniref:Uncharacterized protein n=2 Tax=Piscinibacter terrae TaxID=2496871 RepID=A0A3N7HHD2_9BURK|nr:hypothetical protein DZC73_28485 [Albitalea terrae]